VPQHGPLPDQPRPDLLPARQRNRQDFQPGERLVMRFRSALLLFAFLPGQALLEVAHAQPAPFDMSPERPAAPAPAPQIHRPSRVEPRPAAAPEAPVVTPPTDATPEASPASRPTPPLPPEQARTAEAPPASLPPGHRRYIIPSQSIALTGEYSRS